MMKWMSYRKVAANTKIYENTPKSMSIPILKPITLLAAFVALLGLSSVHAAAQSAPNSAAPLGTNLGEVSYYTGEQPFLNIFKTGSGWNTLKSGTETTETNEEVLLYTSFLDANGYPTTLTGGVAHNFNQISALFLRNLNASDVAGSPSYQAGDYLLQWSGSGTFTYAFDPGNGTCSTSPCKITVSSPSSGGIILTLTSTGSGSNYLHNASLIYCGTWNGSSCSNGYDKLLANGEMFNPTFIALTKPFKTLRFMMWMNTIGNFQTNWTDRPLPGWVFWDDSRTNATINGADPRVLNDGVPAEVMFALCNEVQADCWFNMPPLATDTYVTNFANLAHSLLNSTSRVYVEYANEVWNQVFARQQTGNTNAPLNHASVFQQLVALGHAAYPGLAGNDYGAAFYYGETLRPVQVGHDWKVAWGSDSNRVIRVAAGQNGYVIGRDNCILTSLPDGANACQGTQGGPTYWYGTTGGTVAANVDAFAIAPYFGYAVPDTFTLDQLFTEIMSGGVVSGGYPGGMIKQTLDWAASGYSLAQSVGLPMVAYEGGQSLVDTSYSDTALQALYASANRDPRMGTAYTTYFNGWRNLGGTMFNHYADIGQYSKWGYWGALENYLDTGSPKYNALTGFISSNPCWWIGCAASATSAIPPANTTPPSVPTNLAGSAVSATQINLSWTASTNTAGAVAGYNVFRNGTKVGTISTTSYQDTGLSSGTTYTYAISSYNAAGKTSAQSSSISVTTPAPTPGPPQVVITTPLNGSLHKSATDLNIAATASGASGIASITINANRMTLRTCTSTTSCSVSWQGSSIRSEGTHVVSVTAIDKLGQQTTASVTVLTVE